MSSDAPWRPGAPAERTSMAWIRTSLSILLAGGAAARLALLDDVPWSVAAGLAGCWGGLFSVVLWWWRARRAHHGRTGMSTTLSVAAPAAVLAAAVAVWCVGLASLGLAIHELTN